MAQGSQTSNKALVRGAETALDRFKYDIANEVGIGQQVRDGYWGDVPARQCGAVGGHMVKRMIALAEQSLAQGGTLPQVGNVTGAQGAAGGIGTAGGFTRTGGTTGTTR